MANKVLLKKSSTSAKTPLITDLDYGELALNYADGKLFYKTSGNVIDSYASITATATLTNKTLTSPTINGGALSGTFSGAISLSDTTAATSTTTGALKIAGGLGVAGAVYADTFRSLNNGAGTNYYVGDDAIIGDVNQANTFAVRGQQDASQGYIIFGNANNTAYIGRSGSNPITVSGGQLTITGTVTGSSAIALQLNGYANKGGTGYHDFLSVTNAYGSATNPNKFFRLNSTGGLEIINSAYSANIFTLTDAGALTVPTLSVGNTTFTGSITAGGNTGTSGQVLQSTGSGVQWATVSGSGSALPTNFSNFVEYGVTGVSTSTTVYSFAIATYRAAKYFITVTNGTNYGVYEFMVAHDGTTVYFSGNNNDYVTTGTSVTYFAGDYVEELLDANTRIEMGTMGHTLNWAITGGNLVFSAASTTGTINVKGTATLIKV